MVQPLASTLPVRQPEVARARPAGDPINGGKYDEFRHILRGMREPSAELPSGEQTGRSEAHQTLCGEREILLEEDRYRALAPDEQSSWGRVNPDPAEWLAAITSTGGIVEARAAEPAAPAHAPELSEL